MHMIGSLFMGPRLACLLVFVLLSAAPNLQGATINFDSPNSLEAFSALFGDAQLTANGIGGSGAVTPIGENSSAAFVLKWHSLELSTSTPPITLAIMFRLRLQ